MRLANDALAHALQSVKDAEDKVKEWNDVARSSIGKPDLSFSAERLKEARTELDKANERLKEARAFVMQLPHLLTAKSIITPPCIFRPSQATFTAVASSFWHAGPINHRIAVDALTIMEEKELEGTYFLRSAQEILEMLPKAFHYVGPAGVFCKPYEKLSVTTILTEILARTLDSSKRGLRWYHRLEVPYDGVVDIALYAVRKEGCAQDRQIPCAILETELSESLDTMRWRTLAYLINTSQQLDARSHALLSVEIMLNFEEYHSLSLRCATLTGQTALWNSTIWTGEVTETTLARVLYVLVENAKRTAETEEDDWKVLGPNCALDLKTNKVYKCFDYRYRDPVYIRNATYYMKCLNAEPVVEFENLLVLTYNYIRGSHIAEKSSDFLPILKMLGSLHANQVVHGDIRLSNIVFAGAQSSLIDFDFSGQHGVKKYPPGFNLEILDGYRHARAKENAFLELEHDLYALGSLMSVFVATESAETWYAVCKAVSNGEIEGAIQILEQLQIPIMCTNSVIMANFNASGSLKKEELWKRKSMTSQSSETSQPSKRFGHSNRGYSQ